MRAATLFKRLFQTELLGTISLDAGPTLRLVPDKNCAVRIGTNTKRPFDHPLPDRSCRQAEAVLAVVPGITKDIGCWPAQLRPNGKSHCGVAEAVFRASGNIADGV